MRSVLTGIGIALLPAMGLAQEVTVPFIDHEGTEVGSAELRQATSGVHIALDVTGMPANSWLAFHIHEAAHCDPEEAHEGAGEHFNPTGVEHGYFSETGPHAGDMPNLFSDTEGRIRAEVFNTMVTLDNGDTGLLGRALMIHAEADDYISQPSGDAGDRLACAEIPGEMP